MSVDYLICKNCGDTFCDCGDFVSCEEWCENVWCSDECAKADGFVDEHCLKYDVFGYDELNECREENECAYDSCSDLCEHYVLKSCKYCREEDFDDLVLLNFVLKSINKTREDIILEYKQSK